MKDEILSYRDMCNKININTIQRGMNFRIRKDLSVILMSTRKSSPYDDEIDVSKNLLIYEGHDLPRTKEHPYPKQLDQPMYTDRGTPTENGKFVKSIESFKRGLSPPEKILVFEKLNSGIWSEKGLFNLVDYEIRESKGRKVFKFMLQPIDEEVSVSKGKDGIENSRIIPSHVKLDVWKRDKGKCVLCGSNQNLHYDHDIPFSRGGSSITAKNIRILCAKCNLKKHDRIE
jgi:hypothetical protein